MNRWFTALFISLEIGRCDPAKLIIDQNTNHDFDCSCWNWLLHIRSSKPRGVQIVSLCSSSGRENGARCSNDHVVINSYTLVLPLTCEWAISSAPLPKTQRYHPTQQSFSIGLAEINIPLKLLAFKREWIIAAHRISTELDLIVLLLNSLAVCCEWVRMCRLG